jgi:mono/diheme cytochrome c family protein
VSSVLEVHARMKPPRLIRIFPVTTAALGCALMLAVVTPCLAETEGESADEAALRADARKTFKENVEPFVKTYCTKCHGGGRAKANVNLEVALKDPGRGAAFLHWKKAVANVKLHDMPPEDAAKQPTDEERLQFIGWIGKLKYLSPKDPGPFVIRRLTRVEYGNTLRDLYGVAPSIADRLPEEVFGEGYLNSISPLQSELFLELANQVVEEIVAPEGRPPTRVQKRLFGEAPRKGADLRKAARQVARSLARDAYRRPPTEAELDVLVDIFDLGRENKLDYTASLGLMLKAVLVSPQFLFITPAGEVPSGERILRVDDHQLASRLSYLLWSAPPDARLSALADKGELHKPGTLRAQAERLLMHPRARALFDGFGAQWLGVNDLERQVFDPALFPQVTPALREAMKDEPRLFFESIVRENQRVIRFVDSDYTFLNEPLARLYDLKQPVRGTGMRRVKLENPNRGGVLGMSATLAATSYPTRTSPVRRGVWVLERILGEHVPPPPPDVPDLDAQEARSVEGLTLRQRTELHTRDPVCANCHRVLDPIGFGLENFDAIGRWREKNEAGVAIDPAGTLPTGAGFTSPAELKRLLAGRESDLARNLTERLMAYALGRSLEGYDEIVIDRLMARIAADDHRVRTIITEVITSYLFTHRRVED